MQGNRGQERQGLQNKTQNKTQKLRIMTVTAMNWSFAGDSGFPGLPGETENKCVVAVSFSTEVANSLLFPSAPVYLVSLGPPGQTGHSGLDGPRGPKGSEGRDKFMSSSLFFEDTRRRKIE